MYSKKYKLYCHNCLREFMGRGGQKYCSNDCDWKHQNSKIYIKTRQRRVCPNCNKEFITKHLKQKYCSPSCRLLIKKALIVKTCPICRLEFKTYSKNHKFCSKRCRNRNKYRKKPKNRSSNRSLINKIGKCEICGFSLNEALIAHHYSEKERMVLCGSCHNMWHQSSKIKFAPKEEVIRFISEKILLHQMNLKFDNHWSNYYGNIAFKLSKGRLDTISI